MSKIPEASSTQHPLCVELEGTLVKRNLLYESLFCVLKRSPFKAVLALARIVQGKAAVKAALASDASLDYSTLPYNQSLLDFLRMEKSGGRDLVLVTAADTRLAKGVSNYLGLFNRVIASEGRINLTGSSKRDALEALYGRAGFDYVGHRTEDLPVWRSARMRFSVNASTSVTQQLSTFGPIERTFDTAPGDHRVLRAIRVQQWVKNILVFVPLATSHQILNPTEVGDSVTAFFAFSLTASSVYLLNDILDIQSDRLHPRKRHRPLAAGDLSIPLALGMFVALIATAGLLCSFLPAAFTYLLLGYCALTTAYSWRLRQILLVDAITLAGLYTSRVVAGGCAAQIPMSFWMLTFAGFLFYSLALVKRYAEIVEAGLHPGGFSGGRAYQPCDREPLALIGISSGVVSVLVMALYVSSTQVTLLYRSPMLLLLICPLLLYWISRLWMLAYRGQIKEDPIMFTLKDPPSYFVGAAISVIMVIAHFDYALG